MDLTPTYTEPHWGRHRPTTARVSLDELLDSNARCRTRDLLAMQGRYTYTPRHSAAHREVAA